MEGDFQTPYGEPVSIVRHEEHVGIEFTIDGQHGFIWLDEDTAFKVAAELTHQAEPLGEAPEIPIFKGTRADLDSLVSVRKGE